MSEITALAIILAACYAAIAAYFIGAKIGDRRRAKRARGALAASLVEYPPYVDYGVAAEVESWLRSTA